MHMTDVKNLSARNQNDATTSYYVLLEENIGWPHFHTGISFVLANKKLNDAARAGCTAPDTTLALSTVHSPGVVHTKCYPITYFFLLNIMVGIEPANRRTPPN
jgi:hypothetical protein